jgi:hypothetical protein
MLVIDQIERASSKDLVESIEETSYQGAETEQITYYNFNKSQLPSSVLPMRNQNFIEKDQILERLSNTFFNQNKQIIVINSFSGTGKTTIAIEYGYKFIENNNHHHYAYMIKSDGLKLELEFESLAKKKELFETHNLTELIEAKTDRIKTSEYYAYLIQIKYRPMATVSNHVYVLSWLTCLTFIAYWIYLGFLNYNEIQTGLGDLLNKK